MSTRSRDLITQQKTLFDDPNFERLDREFYVTLETVKDYALTSSSLQFLIMKSCDDGWELVEGAFGPPPAEKADYFSYPNDGKTLIVLQYETDAWDLLVPRTGKEEEFW